MAISKVTTRPAAAQVQAASTHARRRKTILLELPHTSTFPSWLLQACKVTSSEVSLLIEIGQKDGIDEATSSASQRTLFKKLEEKCMLRFNERVKLWRLTDIAETLVKLFQELSGRHDICLRSPKMAKLLQSPSTDRSS